MATGKITKLLRDRGFGFIQTDGSPGNLFFHSSGVPEMAFEWLNEGQYVEFERESDPRYPQRSRAVNVRLVPPVAIPAEVVRHPDRSYRQRLSASPLSLS